MTAAHPSSAGAREEAALADVIARLRRAMRRAARVGAPENTLSVAQLELLSCLAENPGARPGHLARLLRLAPNSVTTLVNGLQKQGMITREKAGAAIGEGGGDTDRRAVVLALTPDGDRAVRDWHATNEAILHAAIAELHPAWQHLLTAAQPALRELVLAIDTVTERQRP